MDERLIFSKWEQKRPSLCIKMMHIALFIKALSKVFKILLQGTSYKKSMRHLQYA
jgi:hypothetical protein